MANNNKSFSRDDNPDDNPAHFLNKMKNTMAKKYKNNYKNIEELENIYDIPNKTNNYNEDYVPGEIMETFDELQENMKDIFGEYSTKKQGMTNPKNMANNKQNDTEETYEKRGETMDGFSSTDDYKKIYSSEYANRKPLSQKKVDVKQLKQLKEKAKSGNIQPDELKKLVDAEQIPLTDYIKIMGLYLNAKGINWQNVKTSTDYEPPRCSKWNKNCGGLGNNILDYITLVMNYIKYIYGLYYVGLRKASTWIYMSTDGKMDGNPSKSIDDVSIIANILNYLIMVPLSIYFSYNWFYIMFYRDEQDQPVEYDFRGKIMKNLKGIFALFRCLVQPVILVDSFLRTYIPFLYFMITITFKYTNFAPIATIGRILTNPVFIYIGLTLLILFMSCKHSENVFKLLLSFIWDVDDSKSTLLNVFTIFLYIIVIFDLTVGIGETNILVKFMDTMAWMSSPFSTLAWFLVLLFFSVMFIRFSGLFVVLYMYIVSYFGLAIFSSGKMSDAYKAVNSAFKESVNTTDNKCPKTKWEKFILKILNMFYENLFGVIYLLVLSYSVLIIFTKMESSSSKIILGTMFSMLIAIVLLVILIRAFINRNKLSKSDIDL